MPPSIAKNLLDSFRRSADRRRDSRGMKIGIVDILRRFLEKDIHWKTDKTRRGSWGESR